EFLSNSRSFCYQIPVSINQFFGVCIDPAPPLDLQEYALPTDRKILQSILLKNPLDSSFLSENSAGTTFNSSRLICRTPSDSCISVKSKCSKRNEGRI